MKLGMTHRDNREQHSTWIPETSIKSTFQGKRIITSSIRAMSLSLLLGGFMAGTTYAAHDTVLKGTLTIDFHATQQDEISQTVLDSEIKFRIPNQGRVAGIRIPRNIDGQPFRGQEFSVSLIPNGCVLDGGPDHGQAKLHLTQNLRRQPIKGTVFKAQVFGGQYECLFGGASQVLPYDPFEGNQQTSALGELLIWWAQVLSNQNPNNSQNVEEEIHRFFEIPNPSVVHRLKFWGIEYPSAQSTGCKIDSKHVRCNRGGSAEGVFSADVRVKFKEQELE